MWLGSDEWRNFLARIGRDENALDSELFESQSDILELRFWASYRGQTLGRTGLTSALCTHYIYELLQESVLNVLFGTRTFHSVFPLSLMCLNVMHYANLE